MATRTITGVTAYRTGATRYHNLFTQVGTAGSGLLASDDGNSLTKASSSTMAAAYIQAYGSRLGLVDPRPSLPEGYTNFTVTSIQVGWRDKLDITSVGVGQVLMQCTAYMTYTGDTFWVTPRVPTQVMSLGTTPRNTYDWDTIYLRRSNLNLSATVGSSGITAAQTFDADRVFAGSAANQTIGPQVLLIPTVGAGTKVGTWTFDNYRQRVHYTYDMQVPETGDSIGARNFFDYR